MAISLDVRQISPSKVWLELFSNEGGTVVLKKSGAVGNDRDLSSFTPGPLKSYLMRLTNWNSVANGISGSRVLLRDITSGGAANSAPVIADVSAVSVEVENTPGDSTSIDFRFSGGAVPGSFTVRRLEMSFIHSFGR
jgi:hypothetical protein